jgi:hypothetical protein
MTTSIKITRTITANGKEYHSLDELPPEIRAAYEQALASGPTHVTFQRITVNGKEYANLDFVPPELRSLISDATAESKRASTSTAVAVVIGLLLIVAYYFIRLR